MAFEPGSLVRARGREWVVLPESSDEFVVVKPLGGGDEEVAGIHTGIETVEPAEFGPPDPAEVGDFTSGRLLRDAVRLSTRAAAGPFRCFGRIAIAPRPYQLVPLLMALRLDPVRLLIADDVGVGKTIESLLIARELLDRGEIRRLAVLCPPHLGEQWRDELEEKFHIDAQLVLPSTAARLERGCRTGESLFDRYPFVVISTDFIKSDRRRDDFLRACPEFVIVDEAHTCAYGYEQRGRHQRHDLVRSLAEEKDRHLVLVTATPHSGKEDPFRSLLHLLDEEFQALPAELSGKEHETDRRRLARHFVQRRRADLAHYLEEDTPFPARKDKEATYRLGGSYRKLFDRALDHARETIGDDTGGKHRQRVRWWSALALLRALASSPRAAAETLRARSVTAATTDAEAADELGRRTVLDAETDEESPDTAPGADPGDVETVPERLRRLAKDAEKLEGNEDKKLGKAIEEIRSLLGDGYSPIVFCRFIATAEYVAENLRKRLKNVAVEPVTGRIPPADREERVEDLASNPRRVLVCTDCLSEGINLQEHFDAVMHYDLSWNPTRHEQREGRVDRYGQNRDEVRILTYYGVDNRIDGIVLDVLLRKQNTIRTSTGVSIPVPANTEDVVEALMEGLLLRGGDEAQQYFEGFDPIRQKLHASWEEAADREKRSRTLFAQRAIDPEVVRRELDEARAASGAPEDVRRFVKTALAAHGAGIEERNGCVRVRLQDADPELRDTLQLTGELDVVFEPPVPEGTLYLPRTAPLVESLASHVLETALESGASGVARRAGVARTRAVGKRTTLLLLRLRYEIHERRSARPNLLAEESRILAFEGAPGAARWLDDREIEPLLLAAPDANIAPEQAREFVEEVVAGLPTLEERLESLAHERSEALADAHGRVREATRRRARHSVEPRLPVDLLGIYVYLPVRS